MLAFHRAQVAIEPKTKGDGEKMTNGLIKLAQEDPSFHFRCGLFRVYIGLLSHVARALLPRWVRRHVCGLCRAAWLSASESVPSWVQRRRRGWYDRAHLGPPACGLRRAPAASLTHTCLSLSTLLCAQPRRGGQPGEGMPCTDINPICPPPTHTHSRDEETNQTVIEGMGELHLEIIVDRLRREFKVECDVGAPQVCACVGGW